MCECLLNKVPICRDNLTSPYTLAKWVVKWIYLGFLCSMISKETASYEDVNDPREIALTVPFIIIYMVHVPALLLARIPIFILYKVFCCCFCDDNEYNSDTDYMELIIHLDYVKYQLGLVGNFENHQRGTQEIAWQRSMRLIRTRVEES
jgi:hypothetical protein